MAAVDPAVDKVIELAVVVFEYCHATGVVGRVLGSYDGLEDPGAPIPPSSSAIHGITDAMVAGQRIDDAAATVARGGRDRDCAQRRWLREATPLARWSRRTGPFIRSQTD